MKLVRLLDRVYAVDSLQHEIDELFDNKAELKKYNNWLLARVQQLNDPNIDCVFEYPRLFEKLKGYSDLYSITYRHSKKNMRILYTFRDDGSLYLLLCGFDEKSKSDYAKAAKKALRRMSLI